MNYQIEPNGSLNLYLGEIGLMGGYPAIDGTPVRPLRVEANGDTAVYTLVNGKLTLRAQEKDGTVLLYMHTQGLEGVHDISVFANAKISGCVKAFRQGLGLGGPSGFVTLDTAYDSTALTAIGNDTLCVTMHVVDQKKYNSHFLYKDGMIAAVIDAEGVLPTETELPAVCIRASESFDAGLRRCAKEIADFLGARPIKKPAFHWCSWYYLYHTLDQQTMESYLDGFIAMREDAPFTHIQIDAGYFPSCGDWLEPHPRFPKGLKGAAETIKAAGYEPGVWIGPFMVGDESIIFREHPDWLLHYTDGTLVTEWQQFNEPKPWGYRDSNYGVLDTSHPDAMAYIRGVFRQLRAWGYTLYKTDFLKWGIQDSARVVRHTPGKTSYEYFRDLMVAIREEIGEESMWLGCIAPFMPAIGFVDMMRIGSDVGARWESEQFNPKNMIREIVADQYFNNVYWQNDPDTVLLRDFHIQLNETQIEALALLQATAGGVITTSDPIHQIAQSRQALLKLIRPDKVADAQFPFWSQMREDVCIVNRLEQGTTVYLFNGTGREIVEAYDWKTLLGKDYGYLRKLHGDCVKAENVPFVRIPARSGVLFFASAQPIEKEPENIWVW